MRLVICRLRHRAGVVTMRRSQETGRRETPLQLPRQRQRSRRSGSTIRRYRETSQLSLELVEKGAKLPGESRFALCNKELPFPKGELLSKLFLRRRSVPHMLLHARFMLGFELLQLRLLIGREHLVQLVMDPRFLHSQLRLDLRLLRGQCLNLCLIECALRRTGEAADQFAVAVASTA